MKNIITLLTDFGQQDIFSSVLKGVILTINPNAYVLDVTHEISSFDINEAALKTYWNYRYYPEGTIHVIVVDPGVGSQRAPIIVEFNKSYFICPDNGVLSYVLNRMQCGKDFQTYKIENEKMMLSDISRTFHGRDIFCPAAAHLSKGEKLENFGPKLNSITINEIKTYRLINNHIEGEVIYIDKFGNCVTNIPNEALFDRHIDHIQIKNHKIDKIINYYKEGTSGKPNAIKGSFGNMEIVLKEGNASSFLNIFRDEKIKIVLAGN